MIWEQILRLANRQPAWARWSLALLFFAIAFAIRAGLARIGGGLPFITFFPAIIGTTLLCGWRPAVMILVLAVFAAGLLLPPPSWYGGQGQAHAVISIALFSVISLFQIAIVAALLDSVRVNHRLAAQQKTLFLELQHRVANTLQFVASMLILARKDLARDEGPIAMSAAAQADEVLGQSIARISAMSELHRRMYDAASDDRGVVALLHDILAELFRGYNVATQIDASVGALPLSQITPLVLLVTEAATNAVKHVFRSGHGSRFEVSLAPMPSGQLCLTIRDDGPGVPPQAAQSTGLGLRIMRGLATELGGTLQIENSQGSVLTVLFTPA